MITLGAGSATAGAAASSSATSPPTGGSAATAGCLSCSSAARAWPAAPATSSAPCCTRPPTAWPASARSQDTSRQGRFHNTRYRALAEELGLEVAKGRALGWSDTTVPDATAALYRAELRRLDAALVAFRHAEPRTTAAAAGPATTTAWRPGAAAGAGSGSPSPCSPPGPITCGLCGSDFEAAEPGG